jgi:ribose 5-phosphate isomerase B
MNVNAVKPDIIIGSDHAGFASKQVIMHFLQKKGYNVEDVGCYNTNSMDYTDIANLLSVDIEMGVHTFGILICGTGQGMAMAANKHNNVRAGVAWNKFIAFLLREHNDANVLCMPSMEKIEHGNEESYTNIVETFLTTPFSNEERHVRRIGKMIQH